MNTLKLSRLCLLSALVTLVACARRPTMLDFEFSAAGDGPTYRSTTIERALRQKFSDEAQPTVIVVATPTANDRLFREQFRILKSLPAEELEALYVVACATGCAKDGYSTPAETTASLAGDPPKFRIVLLDGVGRILRESEKVLGAKEIREIVEARWLAAEPTP